MLYASGFVRYRRVLSRHLPVLVVGIIAGYIAGSNKQAIGDSLTAARIFNFTGYHDISNADLNDTDDNSVGCTVLGEVLNTPAITDVCEYDYDADPEAGEEEKKGGGEGEGEGEGEGNAIAQATAPGKSSSIAEQTPSNTDTKPVRAALVALVRNSDLFGLRHAIRQIEDRFNSRHNYPYVFVNDEPFTEEFMQGVRDVTKANVSFGILDHESWSVPSWISQERFEQVKRTAQYPHGEKESYRLMCRFQSGYLHKHPLLQDLDYYWRIEPDVEYFCDIDYDPFVFMRDNGLKYGWNMAMTEFMDTVATLWNTTKSFIHQHPEKLAPGNIIKWLLDDNGNYNGCHFWSNFEIVDLSFYRSHEYQAFFDHLDRAGGFFYERWGDAPVHSIAASLLLNASQIHYFDDIGYFHPSVYTCPKGSDKRGKCICDPSQSFIQDGYCTIRFKETKQKVLSPEATELIHTGPIYIGQPYVKAADAS